MNFHHGGHREHREGISIPLSRLLFFLSVSVVNNFP
jgi:hypothetical protein